MPIVVANRDYFTPEELLAMFPANLRPSAETLRRRIANGDLHAVKFGPSYLISGAAIHAFLDPTSPPTPTPAISAENSDEHSSQTAEVSRRPINRERATRPSTRKTTRKTRPSFRRALATEHKLNPRPRHK